MFFLRLQGFTLHIWLKQHSGVGLRLIGYVELTGFTVRIRRARVYDGLCLMPILL